MKTIESIGLHPQDGVAHAKRRYSPSHLAMARPWPELDVGETVRVEDADCWIWEGSVLEVSGHGDDVEAIIKITGYRVAKPLPDFSADGVLVLPTRRDHAWSRPWGRGDIVLVDGQYYKVRTVKVVDRGAKARYSLEPASEKQYETRPGILHAASEDDARRAVGSAVEVDGEWLAITKVTYSHFHGALGRGTSWYMRGTFVSAAKAARLNAMHAPTLSKALHRAPMTLTGSAMPDAAVSLKSADGERVAVVDTGKGRVVLHERYGDPDQSGSWRRHVVLVDDSELVKMVAAFVRRAKKAK